MSEKTIKDANDTMVSALVAERAGYARRADKDGKFKDRIAQVDAQLKLRGFNSKGEPLSKPVDRQAPPQQTA